MTPTRANLSNLWRRLSWPDIAAIILVALGLLAAVSGRSGGAYSFAKFVGLLSAGYLAFRAISWWRNRLLWSLRNRLIVAYLFIAVVPVLLLLTLAILAGQILYSQLGGYLLFEDIHWRTRQQALPPPKKPCQARSMTKWWKKRWMPKSRWLIRMSFLA